MPWLIEQWQLNELNKLNELNELNRPESGLVQAEGWIPAVEVAMVRTEEHERSPGDSFCKNVCFS